MAMTDCVNRTFYCNDSWFLFCPVCFNSLGTKVILDDN